MHDVDTREPAGEDFRISEGAIGSLGARAAAGSRRAVDRALARARRGHGLDVDDMATLWHAEALDADALHREAVHARAGRPRRLETFSPLYMTNTCDAECRMCGMRRDNAVLMRETATIAEVRAQLALLVRRGIRGVALLTGEYRAARRPWALALTNEALRAALALGFRHVLINVGAIEAAEYSGLLADVPRTAEGTLGPKVTMCTFQETYSRALYAKFMGRAPDNPRADFDRRLANFDRARRAGMRVANPGILVGLNPDLGYEMVALALHARHLRARGMEVYLSVPRLRQTAGRHAQRGASDAEFIRLVAILALGLPDCKIVVTTREPAAIQHAVAPIVAVISAGSSAVAPYSETGARFPLAASQFEVIDQRPFETILRDHLVHSDPIENFQPVA
jgi:2-iminoacetate synthase ThiH